MRTATVIVAMLGLVATAYAKVKLENLSPPTDKAAFTTGRATEVRCERSLMQTEQMSENEVVELARGLRRP